MGRLGLTGFLVTFAGATLLAISSMFGFIAPVLAGEAPETLDAINMYLPVVVFNGFAAIGFMAGFVILGVAVAGSRVVPRRSGILMAVGAPTHLVGFGIAQLCITSILVCGNPRWPAIRLGSCLVGLRMGAKPGL